MTTIDLLGDMAFACDPVQLARGAGIDPYDYQVAMLRSPARQMLLNWSRQAGKSTATSILPLYTALYQPGSLSIVVGPSDRQAGLLLDKTYDALYAIGWTPQKGEKDNTRYIGLANGSEIWALPGKEGTIRGFSKVALVVIDEAAKASDSLYKAVRPMLAASGGRLVLLSTPFGKRGFFYRALSGEGTWEVHEVPWHRVPHLSEEVIAEDRIVMTEAEFAQEYECLPMETSDQIFTHEMIAGLFSDDVPALFGPGSSNPFATIPVVDDVLERV